MVRLHATHVTGLDALAAILRGDADAPPCSPALRNLARAHGVDLLVARPDDDRGDAIAAEALAVVRERELRDVLSALSAAGITALVIKGAYLAYALYPSPGLRARADTDLLIDVRDRERAAPALASAGYGPAAHVRGTVILGQHHFTRTDRMGVTHALDVHWRIAAPLVLRHALQQEALLERAVPIPALGPAALGPSLADALAIACVHLTAHHQDDPLLLWLYEIALLADRLDADERDRFVETAIANGIVRLCATAIDRTRTFFDNPGLAALGLSLPEAAAGSEPSARLLTASGPVDRLWLDLRASDGWRDRMTLVTEHAWPDADYMRTVHGGWLPLAYVRRALSGALRWTAANLRRPPAESAGPRADSPGAAARRATAKTSP